MIEVKSLYADISDLVGQRTDLAAKYEGSYKPDEEGNEGIVTEIDDKESIEITGEKLALLSNFVKDKTINEVLDALAEKLPEILAYYEDTIAALQRSGKDTRLAILALIRQNGGDVRINKKHIVAADLRKPVVVMDDPSNGDVIVLAQG